MNSRIRQNIFQKLSHKLTAYQGSLDRSVSIVTKLRAEKSVKSGLDCQKWIEIFVVSVESRMALEPTKFAIQCVPGILEL